MTKAEITAALIKGATNTNAKFVNVNRQHLLIALGAAPEPTEEPSLVDNERPDNERNDPVA
jgi:hypothetical protein